MKKPILKEFFSKSMMMSVLVSMPIAHAQKPMTATGNLFNVVSNGTSLSITPTTNHTYPRAGIHLSSGYQLSRTGRGADARPTQ